MRYLLSHLSPERAVSNLIETFHFLTNDLSEGNNVDQILLGAPNELIVWLVLGNSISYWKEVLSRAGRPIMANRFETI